ncbi:MAG: hypothetical protein DI566_03050 [Microbacterium sp.]|nr:MAG: hypothetical protein DI566_03050 [Microbacterium sp.]
MAGVIERRLLISYRLDPGVARSVLPSGLRPQLVDGSAVAGVCMIRLGALRPAWVPAGLGLRMENAAHRIAVEWDAADGPRTGVFIPMRHSASRLAVAAGGRVFPGIHRRARFDVRESDGRVSVAMNGDAVDVGADVELTDEWSSTLFPTLDDASLFFQRGDVGWSPGRRGGLEGVRLETNAWQVHAARALAVRSSSFDALPVGAASFDSVVVMRDVPVVWRVPGGEVELGSRVSDQDARLALF